MREHAPGGEALLRAGDEGRLRCASRHPVDVCVVASVSSKYHLRQRQGARTASNCVPKEALTLQRAKARARWMPALQSRTGPRREREVHPGQKKVVLLRRVNCMAPPDSLRLQNRKNCPVWAERRRQPHRLASVSWGGSGLPPRVPPPSPLLRGHGIILERPLEL